MRVQRHWFSVRLIWQENMKAWEAVQPSDTQPPLPPQPPCLSVGLSVCCSYTTALPESCLSASKTRLSVRLPSASHSAAWRLQHGSERGCCQALVIQYPPMPNALYALDGWNGSWYSLSICLPVRRPCSSAGLSVCLSFLIITLPLSSPPSKYLCVCACLHH